MSRKAQPFEFTAIARIERPGHLNLSAWYAHRPHRFQEPRLRAGQRRARGFPKGTVSKDSSRNSRTAREGLRLRRARTARWGVHPSSQKPPPSAMPQPVRRDSGRSPRIRAHAPASPVPSHNGRHPSQCRCGALRPRRIIRRGARRCASVRALRSGTCVAPYHVRVSSQSDLLHIKPARPDERLHRPRHQVAVRLPCRHPRPYLGR